MKTARGIMKATLGVCVVMSLIGGGTLFLGVRVGLSEPWVGSVIALLGAYIFFKGVYATIGGIVEIRKGSSK